ncbi:MAG TPA: hypothetical protein VHT91_17480 [Kofleriaceae bacterium]|nr:hypothetical protein [Kofleriaceae bacterium]
MTRALPAPLAACAWACACSTPTPQIVLDLAGPPTQACLSDVVKSCADLTLPCDPVMSIRIVEPGAAPDDEKARYLDQCVPVLTDPQYTACALNSVSLDSMPIPVRDLEVQIAVFPGSMARDPKTGALMCPSVDYTEGTGFPKEGPTAPALGRQVFYHPGDATVDVKLGCTDVPKMQAGAACQNPGAGVATATVLGFDTQVPVPVGPGGNADELFVWSGEPHMLDGSAVLLPPDAVTMQLDDNGASQWTAERAQTFSQYACVQVLEDIPQTAATLHCASTDNLVGELTGYWIRRDTLQPILKMASAVLGDSALPDAGLTIGLVVDGSALGVEGIAVQTDTRAHITYLSKTGVGSDATFATGIFVSDDAPFGTTFFAPGARPEIGGLVAGKATIVVLTMGATR